MISALAVEHLGGLQHWTVVDQGGSWLRRQEVGCHVGTDRSALVSGDLKPRECLRSYSHVVHLTVSIAPN
jgi:hypothetical protein